MYLVAMLDWFSRYVITWQRSNTLDGLFCQTALTQALDQARPEIFNPDQGVQLTALPFTTILEEAGVQIRMDGRGRALDNIFIERLWRSVKDDHVYLFDDTAVSDLTAGLRDYFHFYHDERPHQALAYRTPAQVHFAQPALMVS